MPKDPRRSLGDVCVFSKLPEEAAAELERDMEIRQCKGRQIVHFADQAADFVYVVLEGLVKVSRVSRGAREVVLRLVRPREIFGEAAVLELAQYETYAETIGPATVAVLRRSAVVKALAQHPPAALAMVQFVAARSLDAGELAADLTFLDVPQRLAKALIGLHEKRPRKPVEFTHQQIADMVGTTRETTTCLLGDFARRGLVKLRNRCLDVINVDGLRDVADGVRK